MGLSDVPSQRPVKLYCSRCEDIYNPKSSRHAAIDGAYFGTSFHNIIFQVYPALIPTKSAERYVPRVYGFKVHSAAALVRWQNGRRDDMRRRLRKMEIESGFKDGEDDEDEEGVGGHYHNGRSHPGEGEEEEEEDDILDDFGEGGELGAYVEAEAGAVPAA
jgi:casein kinase II subunit beta